MRKGLLISFKKSGSLSLRSWYHVGSVTRVGHHYDHVYGLNCPKRYSTRFPNVNTTVPCDILFGQKKEMFIKSIQKLSSKKPSRKKHTSLAGILVPFCMFEDKPSILFTKRSHRLTRNKGDVSFPGGKKDDSDKDIIETALRETEEEIGLPRSNIETWTTGRPFLTTDGVLHVIPVIAFVNNLDISSLTLDQNEVTSVFAVPIQDLCNPQNQAYTRFCIGITLPLYFIGKYKIWGFTAAVVDGLLGVLLRDNYTRITEQNSYVS